MLRHILFAGLCLVALLSFSASPTCAQAPERLPLPKSQRPPIDGLPEPLQREIERLQLEILQAQREFGRGRFGGPTGPATWGGARLQKVPENFQETLGLPENEGLIVTGVDFGSQADKSGLQSKDVLVKIDGKTVPGEMEAFAKLVQDRKADTAMDLVVVRNGKEETIKAITMPALVQTPPAGRGGFPIRGGPRNFGRANFPGRAGIQNLPLPHGKIDNLSLEMTINGAKVRRKQTADQFSGEFSKDNLTIRVAGKFDNGAPTISEISVQEGKETKNYNRLTDVPFQHRLLIQQMLMPESNIALPLHIPGLSLLPIFGGAQVLDFARP